MKHIITNFKLAFLALFSMALVACGGGGSSSSTSSSTTTSSLSGTAATGAPLAGATITVFDATGANVGSTTADSNGAYSLPVDTAKYKAPFTVQAQGTVGEGSTTIYSLAPSAGTANINQVTNAIAATLSSTGDPAALTSGTAKTATDVNTADSAFSAALTNVTNTLGVTGSFISGTFSSSYDKLLDNVTIDSRPNGGISITTSAGMQGGTNDMLANANITSAYTSSTVSSGSLPSAINASNLPAFSAANMLAISDLEALRSKLQTCFALSTSARGTVASPASECQGLDPKGTSDSYLHDGYYWLDTTANCGANSTGTFCQGLFGYMLTQSTYDNLKFLKPQIIRPLDSTGTLWVVKFPIQFAADNSLAAFGEAHGSSYVVVKKYTALASGSDAGWRFYGNQREVNSFIEANVQRIQNVFTGGVRFETGLNMYINANTLRTRGYSANVYATKVVVTDASTTNPVLPPNGITLYNKGSVSNGQWQSSCSGFMTISQSASPAGCNGVLRLAYGMTGSYGVSTSSDSYLAYWPGSVGTASINGVSGFLSDTQINLIKPGQPFKFVITLSDSSTISYINRVHFTPQNTQDVMTASYPIFTTTSIDAMKTYLGTGGAFSVSWLPISTSRPYSSSIYWQNGAYSKTSLLTQTEVSANAVNVPCTGTGANACATSANWGGSTQTARGLAQVRSRDGRGFQYFSQIRQY
jgi:Bacterial Ig domain